MFCIKWCVKCDSFISSYIGLLSASVSGSTASILPYFDELYRDTKPPCTLSEDKYARMRDPVHRHGKQMLDLRTLEKQSELVCDVIN